jgi:thiol-disulfide isomerase/thioredoxin
VKRLLCLAILAAPAALAIIKPPVPAKEFVLPLRNGTQLKLSSLKGKVVVLEFLLTHCPACQNTGRLLERLQREYGPRGLQVLGCAVDEKAVEGMANYLALSGATFPIGIRKEIDFRGFLELSTFDRAMFPELVVIDRAGVIRYYHGGPGDNDFLANEESLLRKEIELLLGGKNPPGSGAGGTTKK